MSTILCKTKVKAVRASIACERACNFIVQSVAAIDHLDAPLVAGMYHFSGGTELRMMKPPWLSLLSLVCLLPLATSVACCTRQQAPPVEMITHTAVAEIGRHIAKVQQKL